MQLDRIKELNSDEIEWRKLFLDHEYIAVNYHIEVPETIDQNFSEEFQYLAEQEEFKKITFFRVDSKNNPIADQFIREKKLPFVATFMKGFLVECNVIEDEKYLNEMLVRLLEFKLKL